MEKQQIPYLTASQLSGLIASKEVSPVEAVEAYLDRTLLVVARQELRIKRALERGPLTEEDIRRRMNLQMPDAEKRVRADYVIENNDSLAAFEAKLDAFFDQLDIVAGA